MNGFWLVVRILAAVAVMAGLAACGAQAAKLVSPTAKPGGFRSGECNLVSDDDVNAAAGAGMFTKVSVGDSGCFWQENSTIGSFGVGMGVSTWWYRGSDLDSERALERKTGREITELSLDGNSGFQASDENTCSVYVAKGGDVITWSIQTMKPRRYRRCARWFVGSRN